jgi:hypothetical protein
VGGTERTGDSTGVWEDAGVFEGVPALVSGGVEGEGGEYYDEVEGEAGY